MYEVGGSNATDSIAVASYPQYKENISSHFIRVGDTLVRNCSSPFDNIDFENPRIVGSLVPLGIVCLIGPVIDAHYHSYILSQLRSYHHLMGNFSKTIHIQSRLPSSGVTTTHHHNLMEIFSKTS